MVLIRISASPYIFQQFSRISRNCKKTHIDSKVLTIISNIYLSFFFNFSIEKDVKARCSLQSSKCFPFPDFPIVRRILCDRLVRFLCNAYMQCHPKVVAPRRGVRKTLGSSFRFAEMFSHFPLILYHKTNFLGVFKGFIHNLGPVLCENHVFVLPE